MSVGRMGASRPPARGRVSRTGRGCRRTRRSTGSVRRTASYTIMLPRQLSRCPTAGRHRVDVAGLHADVKQPSCPRTGFIASASRCRRRQRHRRPPLELNRFPRTRDEAVDDGDPARRAVSSRTSALPRKPRPPGPHPLSIVVVAIGVHVGGENRRSGRRFQDQAAAPAARRRLTPRRPAANVTPDPRALGAPEWHLRPIRPPRASVRRTCRSARPTIGCCPRRQGEELVARSCRPVTTRSRAAWCTRFGALEDFERIYVRRTALPPATSPTSRPLTATNLAPGRKRSCTPTGPGPDFLDDRGAVPARGRGPEVVVWPGRGPVTRQGPPRLTCAAIPGFGASGRRPRSFRLIRQNPSVEDCRRNQ